MYACIALSPPLPVRSLCLCLHQRIHFLLFALFHLSLSLSYPYTHTEAFANVHQRLFGGGASDPDHDVAPVEDAIIIEDGQITTSSGSSGEKTMSTYVSRSQREAIDGMFAAPTKIGELKVASSFEKALGLQAGEMEEEEDKKKRKSGGGGKSTGKKAGESGSSSSAGEKKSAQTTVKDLDAELFGL